MQLDEPECQSHLDPIQQEIASHYPGKKTVTLVQGGPTLLSEKYPIKFRSKLLSGLEQLKVKVVLNERADKQILEDGRGTFTSKAGDVVEGEQCNSTLR